MIHSPKVKTLNELEKIVNNIRLGGLFKLGFCNGCFDILHPGHLDMLYEGSKKCDFLIIGLNSDSSIKHYKGEHRPINNQADRSLMLSYLDFVSYICIFDEDNPKHILTAIKPEILIKSSDNIPERFKEEKDIVESYNGIVYNYCAHPEYSTTNIINKILKNYS